MSASQLLALGRDGEAIISKDGRFIAIGRNSQVEIYDNSYKLQNIIAINGATPYGNYAVDSISDSGKKVVIRTWNGLLTPSGAGGVYELEAGSSSFKRLDVDASGKTVTYQGWSMGSEDIDFTPDGQKGALAIRDTADSVHWGQQRVNIFTKDLWKIPRPNVCLTNRVHSRSPV